MAEKVPSYIFYKIQNRHDSPLKNFEIMSFDLLVDVKLKLNLNNVLIMMWEDEISYLLISF